jgi:hypothetical protein
VGASLSADVSVEIPLRIINFVSLDPPPGHAAAEVLTPNIASRISNHQLHFSRCWSVDELRAVNMSHASMGPPNRSSVDLDSLGHSDLLHMYGGGHARATSFDSHIRPPSAAISTDASSVRSSAQGFAPSDRHVRHRISLDSIGSAIASATARRAAGHQRSASGLRQEFCTVDEEEETEEASSPPQHVSSEPERPRSYRLQDNAVRLDDLAEGEEEEMERLRHQQGQELSMDDDSEDEVDMVLRSSIFNDDYDDEHAVVTESFRPTTAARPPSQAGAVHPPPSGATTASAKNPSSVTANNPAAEASRPLSFMASPSSPVKAKVSVPPSRPPSQNWMRPPGIPPRARVVSTPARMPSTRAPVRPGPPPASAHSYQASSPANPTPPASRPARRPLPKAPSPKPIVARVLSFSSSPPDLDSGGSTVSTRSSPETEPIVVTPPIETKSLAEPRVADDHHSMTVERSVAVHPSHSKPLPLPRMRPSQGASPSERTLPLPTNRVTSQSVKSKVAALEDRQAAISSFAGGHPQALRRQTSNSSMASSRMETLSRAQSIASFKAPLLRGGWQ